MKEIASCSARKVRKHSEQSDSSLEEHKSQPKWSELEQTESQNK